MNNKNIIVGSITVVVLALMALTASRGGAYNGGEMGKVIEDISPTAQTSMPQQTQMVADEPKDEQKEELDSLKDKAGSTSQVKTSSDYKGKCSACHGQDGSGMQDGKKLMGPKLYGQSADKLYKDLIDFKDGRKENVVMQGLVINTSEQELRKLADEIGSFASQESK